VRLETGKWKLENGKWKLENGNWDNALPVSALLTGDHFDVAPTDAGKWKLGQPASSFHFPVSNFQFLISSFCFVERRSYLCCRRRRAGSLTSCAQILNNGHSRLAVGVQLSAVSKARAGS
jgi:hypothetical protein